MTIEQRKRFVQGLQASRTKEQRLEMLAEMNACIGSGTDSQFERLNLVSQILKEAQDGNSKASVPLLPRASTLRRPRG